MPSSKRMRLNPYLTPQQKSNLKWSKDLNMKAKTTKLTEEDNARRLCDKRFGNFLDMPPEVQSTMENN